MNPTVFTEEVLLSWVWRLGGLHGDLLEEQLDVLQRQRLGGQLLPIGPGLVLVTAGALSGAPHLFPDAPASGPDLEARQRTAYAWLYLRDRLRKMAQLADDGYLAAQASLNGTVVPFIKRNLEQSFPHSISDAEIPHRNMALVPAMLMLHAYFKANNKVRDRNQARAREQKAAAQKAAASAVQAAAQRAATPVTQGTAPQPLKNPVSPVDPADPAPGQDPPPRPGKSASRLRADAQKRAHDRAAAISQFEDILRSRRRAENEKDLPGVGNDFTQVRRPPDRWR